VRISGEIASMFHVSAFHASGNHAWMSAADGVPPRASICPMHDWQLLPESTMYDASAPAFTSWRPRASYE
jgi:hypothetical protein